MWEDPIYDRIPGPKLEYVRFPIYVDLTEEEYKKLIKKCEDVNWPKSERIRAIQFVRSERPGHYDVKRSDKADTLFRWLFKL